VPADIFKEINLMHVTHPYPVYTICTKDLLQNILFSRDHYVEGRMRGVAPSKKIAAVQQKNVDV